MRWAGVFVAATALGLGAAASTGSVRADEARDWIGRLTQVDPFRREEAAAEIRRLGADALEPLAEAMTGDDLELRLRADRIFQETAQGFVVELENEYRALDLDRRELARLEEKATAREELASLRERVALWKKTTPDLDAAVEVFLTLRALEARQAALPKEEKLSGDDLERLQSLVSEVESLTARIPDLEEKAEAVARYYRLEMEAENLADERDVEALRIADLRERITAREPTVADLLARTRRVGAPLFAVIASRRWTLPLRDVPLSGDLRSAVLILYDELIDEARETSPETSWSVPVAEAAFDRDRYLLSWLWEAELAADGPHAKEAGTLLDRHVERTLQDLDAPLTLLRERAATELYRLRKRGWVALQDRLHVDDITRLGGGEENPHVFLACLLRWRISPELYARVGLQFGDYKELSFPARRRKVFQFARTAGQDAIPTLRAIVLDDELERGFLVKYAAAKALAVQLGDQLGYLVLKSLHPDLVVKRPEISRELRIIQGQAHIRERNYEAAIEEFAKILETSPFDFEGNYHIAFAYLLLKNYPKAIHHFEIARRVRPRDQLTLYNLACAYSLHGDLDDAVRTLDEAVEAGFVDVDHMKGDHDLDPIREHPRFPDILRKAYERGSQSVPEN